MSAKMRDIRSTVEGCANVRGTAMAETFASRSSPWVTTASVLTIFTQPMKTVKRSATRVGLKSASTAIFVRYSRVKRRMSLSDVWSTHGMQRKSNTAVGSRWNGNRTKQPDLHSVSPIHRRPNYRPPEAEGINKEYPRHFAENILQGLDLISRPQGADDTPHSLGT